MVNTKDILIAVDDGHGPHTAGKRTPYIAALGRQIRENEFNKPTANYLESELKRCGFRTMQLAPTDVDTGLTARTNAANRANADMLVSIHFNAMGNTFAYSSAKGFSVHIQEGLSNSSKAYKLAQLMIDELKAGTPQVNRGIVKQNLAITRQSKMTAVLVECGFMDDPTEALLMISPAFQQEVARELAKAICRFYGVPYKGASGSTPAAKPAPAKPAAKPAPKPVTKPSGYTGASLVDYLKSVGQDPSYANRAKLAKQYGVSNYSGTATQNLNLLAAMRGAKPAAAAKPVSAPKSLKVGDVVTLKKTAKTFATGQSIASHALGKKYKVLQLKTDRVLLDGIMSWVKKTDI